MGNPKPSRLGVWFDRLLQLGVIISGIMIFVMMFSICYDVIARYLFNPQHSGPEMFQVYFCCSYHFWPAPGYCGGTGMSEWTCW